MADVEKMSVALSSELAELMRSAVAGENYNSSIDVIQGALRDWKVKQAIQTAEIEVMQVALIEGLADVKAGLTSPASSAPIYENVAGELRNVPFGSYLIFYKLEAQTVFIVRVLHSAQDVTRQKFDARQAPTIT